MMGRGVRRGEENEVARPPSCLPLLTFERRMGIAVRAKGEGLALGALCVPCECDCMN